jgi:hypothetical protein
MECGMLFELNIAKGDLFRTNNYLVTEISTGLI